MKRFFVLPLLLIAFALVACGPDWSVGPDDGGSGSGGGGGGGSSYSSRYFNKRFYYYFGEDCRYDAFGQSYDCSDYYSLSPMVNASLQITYDGYATLCVDDECSRYDPGEAEYALCGGVSCDPGRHGSLRLPGEQHQGAVQPGRPLHETCGFVSGCEAAAD